ncbi:uncharacterized protein B0T15DRAFT_277354 [Chaetomium strumarium]|uniref:Uncharacterized protein n=1 Tax=Chaetomium strumarium TaxID=1170767 RepID=A0AAJ0GP24_9PEZI|nr:hypothetical protein B0T15DRAFT_277354 [Chaetomium strumarium]
MNAPVIQPSRWFAMNIRSVAPQHRHTAILSSISLFHFHLLSLLISFVLSSSSSHSSPLLACSYFAPHLPVTANGSSLHVSTVYLARKRPTVVYRK